MVDDNTRQPQNLDSFLLPSGFRGRSAVFVQIWWLVQSTLFACSPQFMFGWRRWLLRLFGAQIGYGVLVRPSSKITYPWNISIGDFAWIGDDVVLYSLGEIEIGANAVISQRSYLCAASHDYSQSNFPIYAKKVCIGKQAWLATDVFVAPGVNIGEGCVVGARSSVFHDLPAMMVCIGSPAKPVKPRKNVASHIS
jgi:putative colanic acid biosynthesis acetyltransferase WcaF